MKFLMTAAILFTMIQPLFSEQLPKNSQCQCKNCKCLQETHCGCYSDKGCACSTGNEDPCSIQQK